MPCTVSLLSSTARLSVGVEGVADGVGVDGKRGVAVSSVAGEEADDQMSRAARMQTVPQTSTRPPTMM